MNSKWIHEKIAYKKVIKCIEVTEVRSEVDKFL